VQQSIHIACLPGPQQQTRRTLDLLESGDLRLAQVVIELQ